MINHRSLTHTDHPHTLISDYSRIPLSQYPISSQVIHGLIGVRPRFRDNALVVNPLVPADTWDYFCLDRVYYHKRWITILWDKTGTRYHRGQGLRVYADGVLVASSTILTKLKVTLSPLTRSL